MVTSRFPHDTTKLFCDIFPDEETFADEYKGSGIYLSGINQISGPSISVLFYLLYGKFANSAIANLDENQFKYKVFCTMFQYGPAWEKKIDIQQKLRSLTDTDLVKGSKAINAHAFNMGDDSVIATDDPTKIDQKSSTYYEKSKIEGYALLLDLIETDVTEEFLNKFKPLFATFVYTEPDIYITDIEGDEEYE